MKDKCFRRATCLEFFAWGRCGLIWLTTSPCSFGQARDRRLEDAMVGITLLKRLVAEHGRIADLEKL